MKYALLSMAALAVSLILGVLLFRLLTRKRGVGKGKRLLAGCGVGLLLFCCAGGVYLGVYAKADERATAAMVSSAPVSVAENEDGYLFDGPGTDALLVFYPGGKVDETAYAPLMRTLAENGIDCLLIKMPLRLAMLGYEKAGAALENGDYQTKLLCGHSLGASAAALYAADHPETLDGLILLAGYSTKPVAVPTLCVYGSEDGVLERGVYEDAKQYLPTGSAETVITGGNHANFGNYGAQSGDGNAAISAEAQQETTAREILAFAETLQ